MFKSAVQTQRFLLFCFREAPQKVANSQLNQRGDREPPGCCDDDDDWGITLAAKNLHKSFNEGASATCDRSDDMSMSTNRKAPKGVWIDPQGIFGIFQAGFSL